MHFCVVQKDGKFDLAELGLEHLEERPDILLFVPSPNELLVVNESILDRSGRHLCNVLATSDAGFEC